MLGEKHNLGQTVIEGADGMIHKPRTVYWEWLFLGKDSPLRELVDSLAMAEFNPMGSFPALSFQRETDSVVGSGSVEKLILNKVSCLSKANSKAIGGALASCAWFGLTDLHFENVMSGLSSEGQFIFCPVDIECVFEKLDVLSQTQLVSSKTSRNDKSGCKSVLNSNVDIASLCMGFVQGLEFFREHEVQIDNCLLNLNHLRQTPLRIVIKPTKTYLDALSADLLSEDFYSSEVDQLSRGDVPYFYCTLDDGDLRYVNEDGSSCLAGMSRNLPDVLEPFYGSDAGIFKRDINSQWIKRSLCQICRTFDPKMDTSFSSGDFEVFYKEQSIYMKMNGDWRLKCGRKLRQSYAA